MAFFSQPETEACRLICRLAVAEVKVAALAAVAATVEMLKTMLHP